MLQVAQEWDIEGLHDGDMGNKKNLWLTNYGHAANRFGDAYRECFALCKTQRTSCIWVQNNGQHVDGGPLMRKVEMEALLPA
ncbi:hypothetical protein E3N88_40312 [Mikania micrantha]|uniref:Uncharacterized protein n=1 Tax=Mikania micrantha TaxID=192012 RepID=A0A5N6LMD6_9ASTR|nr:hypothetical protein E3N88_40312 [Mikania micrantha]